MRLENIEVTLKMPIMEVDCIGVMSVNKLILKRYERD